MAKLVLTVDTNLKNAKVGIQDFRKEVSLLDETLSKVKVNKDLTTQINALTKHYKALADATAKQDKAQAQAAQNAKKLELSEAKLATEKAKTLKIIKEIEREEEKTAQTRAKNAHQKEQWAKQEAQAIQKAAQAEAQAIQNAEDRKQKEYEETRSKVEQLRLGFANLINSAQSAQKNYKAGTFTNIINEAKNYSEELSKLNITEAEGAEKAQQLAQKLTSLKTSFAETKASGKNLHGSLTDIVTGFLKFQASAMLVMKPLQLIRKGFSDLNETLVETENTVISLKRVLDEGDSLSNNEISSELYRLAKEYGQTFENVSEIVGNFARSGMSFADSVKASEAALMALNVAELTATEASEGLIAVMAQFGYQAKDLEYIIDVLNKVADESPVSTEGLLSALQKSGSYAKSVNLTLEETVALISALSESTAASGQNIGNALKALFAYTTKTEALDTFAKLSKDMETVVNTYKTGGASILDVWEQLSVEMKNLSAAQADMLAGAEWSEELENELSGSLSEVYDDLKGVYDTAGTYRKNYFIALLNNMDSVGKTLDLLGDKTKVLGYSAAENESAMESYTNQLNSTKAAWQELLNTSQSALEFKKWLLEAAQGGIEFINTIGGIKTVAISAGAALTAAFAPKLLNPIGNKIAQLILYFDTLEKKSVGNVFNMVTGFDKFGKAIEASRKATELQKAAIKAHNTEMDLKNLKIGTASQLEKAHKTAMDASTAATEANTIATEAWGAALSTALGWISLVITGVTMLTGYIKNQRAEEEAAAEAAKQEMIDLRNEALNSIQEYETSISSLDSLLDRFVELRSSENLTAEAENELLIIQGKLKSSYGEWATDIDLVNGKLEDQVKILEGLSREEAKRQAVKLKESYDSSSVYLKDNVFASTSLSSSAVDAVSEYIRNNAGSKALMVGAEEYYEAPIMTKLYSWITGGGIPQDIKKYALQVTGESPQRTIEDLYEAYDYFSNSYYAKDLSTEDRNSILSAISNLINQIDNDSYQKAQEIVEKYNNLLKYANGEISYEEFVTGIPKTEYSNPTGGGENPQSTAGYGENLEKWWEEEQERRKEDEEYQNKKTDILENQNDVLEKQQELQESQNELTEAENAYYEAIGYSVEDLTALQEKENELKAEGKELSEDEQKTLQWMLDNQDQLLANQEEINNLKQEQSELTEEVKDNLTEHTFTEEEILSISEDINNSTELHNELLESGKLTLEEQNELLEIQNSLKKAGTKLDERMAELEKEKSEALDKYNEKIEKANEKKEQADETLEDAQADYQKGLLDIIEDAEKDIISLNEKIESKKESVLQAQNKLLEAQKKLLEAQNELIEKRNELEEVKNKRIIRIYNEETGQFEWQADEKKVADAEENIEKSREAVANAMASVAEASKSYTEAQAEYETFKTETEKEIALYREAQDEARRKYEESVAEIGVKYTEAESKYHESLATIEEKYANAEEKYQDTLDEIEREVDEAKKDYDEKIAKIEKEIQEAKDDYAEAVAKYEEKIANLEKDVDSRIEGLEKEVEKAREDLTKAQENLNNAQENLNNAQKAFTQYIEQGMFSDVIALLKNGDATQSDINKIIDGWIKKAKEGGYYDPETIDGFISILESVTGGKFSYGYDTTGGSGHTDNVGGSKINQQNAVYDNGGVLNGLGGIKACKEDEVVLAPELAGKILTPKSNAEFDRFTRNLGLIFDAARTYTAPPIIQRMGDKNTTTNNSDNRVIMNGVNLGESARNMTLDQIFSMWSLIMK